jgi:hypothetical protein
MLPEGRQYLSQKLFVKYAQLFVPGIFSGTIATLQNINQCSNIFHLRRPACCKADHSMILVIFFPEAELHFFAQFLHFLIFQDNKNLIGWGINEKFIALLF